MIPKGLQIGDTFDQQDFRRTFRYKVIDFDGQGNYISELVGEVKPEATVKVEPVAPTTDASTDDGLDNQPVVAEPKEVKKTAPKKKPAAKKKTATKKK